MVPHPKYYIVLMALQIQFLESKGLINFKQNIKDNGIALCTNCHGPFDDTMNPGCVSWPEDLQYFIHFELRDRARRRCLSSTDPRARSVPTARQYREYQRAASHLGEDCSWGFYRRFHLTETVARTVAESLPTKQWSGVQLATLRRAIGVIRPGSRLMTFPNYRSCAICIAAIQTRRRSKIGSA